MKRLIRWFFVLTILAVAGGAGALWYLEKEASQISLPPLKMSDSSVILASDGTTELGHIASTGRNNGSLTDEQLSPLLRQAHMAAEDRSFLTHGAISPVGMGFAMLKNLIAGSLDAGGSTITQQYVKNAYLTQEKTGERKLKEIPYSYRVEHDFTKDQIMTKFCNSNYYGRGAYGVGDAAQVWFGVPATELNDMNDPLDVARAAFLASLIRIPSEYDDYEGTPSNLVMKKEVYERVEYVLDGLRDLEGVPNMVSPEVIAQAKRLLPLELTDTLKPSGNTLDGDPYLADYARDWLTAWQIEAAKSDGYDDDEAKQKGTATAEAMMARGGLRVVTTLDANLHREVAEAVNEELPDRGLSAGAVIQNPQNGAIVAMYAGNNHEADQFNYALYANRQIGSVMKAVVLSDAVSQGISVKSVLPSPRHIVVDGTPIANDGDSPCPMNLMDAMAFSNNPVHIELITGLMASCDNPVAETPVGSDYPVSPASVAALARKMGADDSLVPGATNPAQLDEVPTLALGVTSMTPPKVATIGSTLASGGMHTQPYLMIRVEGPDGTAVFEHETKSVRVMDESYAEIVNQVLTGVFTRGTANEAQVEGYPMAGKTGTTDSDAWGLMYNAVDPNGGTPAYVCAAWAGYPDNRLSNGDLWGSQVMKICQHFMAQALAGTSGVDFPSADLDAGRIVGLDIGNGVSATPEPSAEPSVPASDMPAPSSTTGEPEPSFTLDVPFFDDQSSEPDPSLVPTPDNSQPWDYPG